MKSDLAVTLVVLMISVCLAACDDPVTSAEVALASPLNHFAVTLFQKVSSEPDNVVISPFSLATALSMLLLGARGETKSLIQSKLNLDNVPNSDGRSIHQLFHDLIESRLKENSGFSLVNMALVGQSPAIDESVMNKYIGDVARLYSADAQEVDFAQGEKIKNQVNSKIKKFTHGLIPTVLDEAPGSDTVFILLNAIYFRQQWLIPFDPDDTVTGTFYNNGNTDKGVQTPFMQRSSGMFKGVDLTIGDQAVQTLEMKYNDKKTTMTILLPNERDGLQKILSSPTLDSDLLTALKDINDANDRLKKTNVLLPKFKFDSNYKLRQILTDMGLGHLFNVGADLTGVGGDASVHLSAVNQKAFINVDEKGTEAAGISTVFGVSRSLSPVRQFTADHPFLFLIRDMETGLVFFIGKVEKF